jgi:hypothetical protein
MEQRGLQRLYRTSKRELNNSEEKKCETWGDSVYGTVLQTRGQKRKMKRKRQIIEEQQFQRNKRARVQ